MKLDIRTIRRFVDEMMNKARQGLSARLTAFQGQAAQQADRKCSLRQQQQQQQIFGTWMEDDEAQLIGC